MAPHDTLRRIPAVGRLLDDPALHDAVGRWGRPLVAELLRRELTSVREEARGGREPEERSPEAWAEAIERRAGDLLRPAPRTVVNATGIVVHTNLGRAVLSTEAAGRVAEAARGYLDLEFDLARGGRGDRMASLEPLLGILFPSHASVAVNNNAAAIFLTLRALARRKEVIVSRGELVEIGGSFRVPQILEASGARLVEVGTTNKTRVEDYVAALSPKTGAVLKVHASNFAMTGFTEAAGVAELAAALRGRDVPLVVDWGSGDLIDLSPFGIADETPVGALLRDGADLVAFSGDKLLGGPQAGLVVGRPELVRRIRRDPVARIARLDRLQIAALSETLRAYATGRAVQDVPTLRMLALSAEEIGRRAEAVGRGAEASAPGLGWSIVPGVSRSGGGSSPTGEIATQLLAIALAPGDAAGIERRLRRGEPPVVARVQDGRVLLDLRTVLPEQDEALAGAIARAVRR